MKPPPNVSYRQYYYWASQGLVDAADPHLYMTLAAMGKLRDAGFETELAAIVAKQIIQVIVSEGDLPLVVEVGTGVAGLSVTIDYDEFFDGLTP